MNTKTYAYACIVLAADPNNNVTPSIAGRYFSARSLHNFGPSISRSPTGQPSHDLDFLDHNITRAPGTACHVLIACFSTRSGCTSWPISCRARRMVLLASLISVIVHFRASGPPRMHRSIVNISGGSV